MAKTKAAAPVATAPAAKSKSTANKLKEGRVSKPELTKPAKSAAKMGKVTKKKAKDDDSDDDESASSSDSDDKSGSSSSDSSGSDSDSGSSSGSASGSESDSSSDSDSKTKTKKSKAAPAKVNGSKLTNGVAAKEATDGSESDDEDDSDADEVPPKPTKAVAGAVQANGKAPLPAKDDSSSDSSSDDEGSNIAAKKDGKADASSDSGSSSGSDSGSDSSSSSGSDDESEGKAKKPVKPTVASPPQRALDIEAAQKKRKADDFDSFNSKKPKADSQATKNLFVGNLSFNVDEEWLKSEFAEFGEVLSARVITNPENGRSRGFAYVDFANDKDAEAALFGKRGTMLDNRPLNVDFATPRSNNADNPRARADSRANKFGDAKSQPSDTLWVGNLPFSTDSDELRQVFEEHGTVSSVRLPTDFDTGAIKGFGYVSFGSVEEATTALGTLQGTEIQNRLLRLDFAPPRQNNGGGSRGGRGMPDGNWRGGRGGGDRGGRGGRGGFGGGDRGGFRGRGGSRGGRGNSTNRGGVGDFSGTKVVF